MTHSRRKFLRMLGIVGGSVAVIGPVQRLAAAPRAGDPLDPSLAADEFEALAGVAFTRAKALGCSDAHVRITCSRTRAVSPRTDPDRRAGLTTGTATRVPAVVERASIGFMVGVSHSGAWGFAQIPSVGAESLSGRKKKEIARLTALATADARANARLAEGPVALPPAPASRDRWVTPRRKHPFDMPARAQRAFRQSVDNAVNAGSGVTVHGEETYFVSTSGAYQHAHRTSVA